LKTVQQYHWLHIPTGMTGLTDSHYPMSDYEILKLLNEWNRSNPGVWQYWAVV